MASLRTIKTRIKSVSSTGQITNAMNLVAASKLQRARTKLNAIRPFYKRTQETIHSLIENSATIRHPYLIQRPINKILIVLITGDRGLCGGYNTTVSKVARNLIRGDTVGALIIVGTKGRDFFIRRRKKILRTLSGVSENPFYEDAVDIADQVVELYKNGDYDKVYLVYTQFNSTINHEPKVVTLLPVDTASYREDHKDDAHEDNSKKSKPMMNYEPSEVEVLNYIVPKYVNTMIYGAMVEASTCQQAARMTGMDAATENANALIGKLTIKYNRARQGAITQELTEIVGGANAQN